VEPKDLLGEQIDEQKQSPHCGNCPGSPPCSVDGLALASKPGVARNRSGSPKVDHRGAPIEKQDTQDQEWAACQVVQNNQGHHPEQQSRTAARSFRNQPGKIAAGSRVFDAAGRLGPGLEDRQRRRQQREGNKHPLRTSNTASSTWRAGESVGSNHHLSGTRRSGKAGGRRRPTRRSARDETNAARPRTKTPGRPETGNAQLTSVLARVRKLPTRVSPPCPGRTYQPSQGGPRSELGRGRRIACSAARWHSDARPHRKRRPTGAWPALCP